AGGGRGRLRWGSDTHARAGGATARAPPSTRAARARRARGCGCGAPAVPPHPASVTTIEVGVVDVFVIRPRPRGWRVLVLQRGEGTRCPTAWETVHGRIEPGERPEDAAVRELAEETGLVPAALSNVTCTEFYLHATQTFQIAAV